MSNLTLKSILAAGAGSSLKDIPVNEIDHAYGDEIASKEVLINALPARIDRLRADVVGDNLSPKVCPAMLVNGAWVILVTAEFSTSDVVEAVKEKCRFLSETKEPVAVYTVTPSLLLMLEENDGAGGGAVTEKSESVYRSVFKEMIEWGIKNDASDITLNVRESESYSQVLYTIFGQLTSIPRWQVQTERLKEILNVAWQDSTGGTGSTLDHKTETQCRVDLVIDRKKVMGRWAGMATDSGLSVTLRLQKLDEESSQVSLEELGFMETQIAAFTRAQNSEGGAIVLAGVVNSGKSRTIASLLSSLPSTRKIATLEDPVEFLIPRALQNTIPRSLSGANDEKNYLSKLSIFKRSAVNDLLLGEIRDLIGGRAFIDISGSGTNLYTTVHVGSAGQIPERLASKSIGVPLDLLASPGILNLLVFQALLPKICAHCSLPIEMLELEGGVDLHQKFHNADYWKRYTARIQYIYGVDTSSLRIRNQAGCKHCQNPDLPLLNGYNGRTPVLEMIEPNVDREILRRLKNGDTLGIQEHLENLPRAAFDHPDMTNKSLMECAIYKGFKGEIDPRVIELRTKSFETVELMKKRRTPGSGGL